MNAQIISNTKKALLLTLIVSLQACGPGSQTNSPADPAPTSSVSSPPIDGAELFEEVVPTSVDESQADGSYRRRRFVKVNFTALKQALAAEPGTVLRLYPFKQESIDVVIESIERLSPENVILVGRIQGDEDSAVTLVMNEGALVANFRRGDREEVFEIRHTDKGVHTIRVPDGEEDENCIEVEGDAPADSMAVTDEEPAIPMANPVVRMLVAYTPNARSRQGGTNAMKALIQMGIADTNRALLDSGVALSVELAGTLETRQNETTSYSGNLSSLRMKTDGRWDEVHKLRKSLLADQVTLVGAYTNVSGTAGIGYISATSSYAFTIVKASAFGMYTFSHELGHNLGLRHTDGYVNSSGRFRTIIAYGTYPRIRRYSNPNRTYNGYRTGTSTKYEAKILNANGLRFSGLSKYLTAED